MNPRVVLWGTGSIGRVALRHVIDRPDLELVGVRVYNSDKVGQDAGDLVRRRPTGIVATDKVDEILSLDADVVLHTPLNGEDPSEHVPDLTRLLDSGKNVITTVGYTYPHGSRDLDVAELERAAHEGGATLFGTGINPGFITERIAVAMSTVCTDLHSIHVREVYDCAPVASPGFIYDLCGFGKTREEFLAASAGRERFFTALFGEVIRYVGDALGVSFVDVVAAHEQHVASRDLVLRAGPLAEGTVSAMRWRWIASTERGPFLTIQMDWRADEDAPGFEGEDGWTISIDGAPRLEVAVRLGDPVGVPEKSKAMQYAVAGPVVSAIRPVIEAPAGFLVPPVFAPWVSASARRGLLTRKNMKLNSTPRNA